MEPEIYENFDISISTFNNITGQQPTDAITSSVVAPTEEHDNSYVDIGGLE